MFSFFLPAFLFAHTLLPSTYLENVWCCFYVYVQIFSFDCCNVFRWFASFYSAIDGHAVVILESLITKPVCWSQRPLTVQSGLRGSVRKVKKVENKNDYTATKYIDSLEEVPMSDVHID